MTFAHPNEVLTDGKIIELVHQMSVAGIAMIRHVGIANDIPAGSIAFLVEHKPPPNYNGADLAP